MDKEGGMEGEMEGGRWRDGGTEMDRNGKMRDGGREIDSDGEMDREMEGERWTEMEGDMGRERDRERERWRKRDNGKAHQMSSEDGSKHPMQLPSTQHTHSKRHRTLQLCCYQAAFSPCLPATSRAVLTRF